ncbi:MAG TPA: homoserine O-succinyltransferase [Acidimicrobiales bacterium]|nr:homoserine O-succinyltransferase [Acidimicrobiales bacterium]
MPLQLVRAAARPGELRSGGPVHWTCALVNNIPDGAFLATESQFLDLLDASSGSNTVEVRRYTMKGVPRGERTTVHIDEEYSAAAEIAQHRPDLLIVTGSEPIEDAIEDEPYWNELVELLEWGSENVASMLLSCLSAHAALAVFDGVARTQLAAKCTGVFPQEVDDVHPLTAGLASPVVLPHSRFNTVPVEAVRAAGYHVGMHSEAVGWSVVSKAIGRSEVVLVQGHPEYEPSSLLTEYRRDVRRYVLGERDAVPSLPLDCAAPSDWQQLQQLQRRLENGERDPALVEAFPFEAAGDRAPWPWRSVATRLYANWLAGVAPRSD